VSELGSEDRFRAGDPDVFKELVARESPRLLAYAVRLTGDRASAEDVVQQVWVQAYRARRSYLGIGPLTSWLLAICRREAAAARRQEQRQIALASALSHHTATEPGESSLALPASGEEADHILALIADLPERQRDVLVCRVLEERSTRETALQLGIAEGTVKATMHQALQRLRKMIGGEEHE
jgi:RNA polymerase sigma-70 factor (ECF subfamily)